MLEKRLTHPGDPDLDRHIAACVARQTDRGTRLDKAKSRDQIDAAISLAMAVERSQQPVETVAFVGWL